MVGHPDALWLVSKTVSDKLRAHLLAQGIDGIPANNTAVFNVLQDHGMLQPTPDGKAIWRATISSEQRLVAQFHAVAPGSALIWETANDQNHLLEPHDDRDGVGQRGRAAHAPREGNPLMDAMEDFADNDRGSAGCWAAQRCARHRFHAARTIHVA